MIQLVLSCGSTEWYTFCFIRLAKLLRSGISIRLQASRRPFTDDRSVGCEGDALALEAVAGTLVCEHSGASADLAAYL